MLEMNLPPANGLFITGTDTGVGKTLVAGGIAKILNQAGFTVGVFKPVATGCKHHYEGLVSTDAEFLRYCSNCDFELSVINPAGFVTPAAPVVCQEFERRYVDFAAIQTAYEQICEASDFVIVEGIGGVRVPISGDVDVLELAKAFHLPVVIVARPYLGTINHTLLTIDAIRGAGLDVAGVVISGYEAASATYAEETGADVIAEYGQTEILAIVPQDEESDVENCRLGDLAVDALTDCDWSRFAQQ
ncbi:MAG TPA: dethiobiotin synthase [Planctomycetes bacterium]|nr:dethiobiotin synthase [Planctomycetota bacterium]